MAIAKRLAIHVNARTRMAIARRFALQSNAIKNNHTYFRSSIQNQNVIEVFCSQ